MFLYLRNNLRIAIDKIVDFYYNIDTASRKPELSKEPSHFGDAGIKNPVSYWVLKIFLNPKRFSHKDVFFDVGCGEGRVLCMVARQRISKCVGIELSKKFAEKARSNAQSMNRRKSPIQVVIGDAINADYSEGTIYYFGDPFGQSTMEKVLENIELSLIKNPRNADFFFFLPKDDKDGRREVIRKCKWLSLKETKTTKIFYQCMEHYSFTQSRTS